MNGSQQDRRRRGALRASVWLFVLLVAALFYWKQPAEDAEQSTPPQVTESTPITKPGESGRTQLREKRREQVVIATQEQPIPARTSLVGQVVDPSGSGIEGATVRLRWLVRGTWPFEGGLLSEVRTGPDGRFGRDLDEILSGRSRTERLRLELYGEASARGYRRGQLPESAGLSIWQADEVVVRIVLVPGGAIRGRVVDQRGLPVEQATVRLHAPADEQANASGVTDEGGHYELTPDRPGRFHISAGSFNVGAGQSSSFAFRVDQDLDLLDIVLRGDGLIEGRLVNPLGEPLDGVEVFAHPEGSLEETYFELVSRRVIQFPDLGAATAGLPRSEVLTDAAGRFQVAGLAPGRYFLLFPGTLGDDSRERALIETGRRNLQVIAERYRVLARVVDAANKMRRNASVQFQFQEPHQLGLPPSSVMPDGRFVADRLTPGTRLEILARTEEGLDARQSVEVKAGVYDTEIEVRLKGDPAAPRGVLRIEPFCSDGTPISRCVASIRPSGDAALTGFGFRFQTEVQPGQALPALPPGRYAVQLESVNEGLFWHGRRHSWFFPAALEVQLEVGSQQVVPIEVRRGGRLRVHFRTDMQVAAEGFEGTWQNWQPSKAAPSRLLFQHDALGELPGPWQPFRLHPGFPAVCTDLLEPGQGELNIDVAGFLPVSHRLSIQPGDFTDVEILLAPR